MEGTPQTAVTPEGVRDGDPAVLAALIARRGPAVLAFCDAVCEPAVAPRAVAEAFARFRALVAAVDDAAGVDPEQFLLGATRHAAASMARSPTDDRGVLRVLGRGTSQETYAAVPALLAARADSMLGGEDLERLSRLLERSPGCREVEAAFRRAERGYRSPPDRPIAGTTVTLITAAMHAAAPIAADFAVPVEPDEGPPPEQADEPRAEAEIVLPDPEQPTAVFQAVEVGEAADAAPAPHDGPQPPEAVAEPVPFSFEDEHVEAGEDEATHPSVPAVAPALMPLADIGVPVAAPPPRPRRRLSTPRLPHGGGLHLPRRGHGGAADGSEPATAVDHGPVYQLLLPAVAIVIAVLVMLAIAGVFGGGDPAPAAIVTPAASVTPTDPTVTSTAAPPT
ncbi:MAG: hypothetical protein JWO02_419, partial [Solirubrobacterales bacterium]|nr:hypothetical protein [Solirubrobacterales bacterium]